jgi:anti-sigma regulatory factor (Ser/Thr protein kinase)
MREQTSRFQAKSENLASIGMFISHFMKEAHLSDEQIYNFELSVDEHFSNLVEHAFCGHSEEEITITCREDPVKAQVIIADSSGGFDPRNYSIPAVEGKPIYELPPGGFGNYFICELMDEVDYVHQPYVKNQLILTVYKKSRCTEKPD